MTLRAEQSVLWPGMSEDIRDTRATCKTCHIIAPSQPNMPPVQPIIPSYPFQHICCVFFALHGNYFGVVVDRFSGWRLVQHIQGQGWSNLSGGHDDKDLP